MSIRLSAWAERIRSSLFFVPLVFVVLGALLGLAMLEVDARLDEGARRVPLVLSSTVDSAREVLGVVAAATITVAGIAFSISLLVIQQASSQYSPRVVHSLFRDPFNRRVMGLSLGTFTYCLIVLRAVRDSVTENGDPVIPNLAVGVAVLLGIGAILAIVAFIDHNAHTMEVSQILDRVSSDTVVQITALWDDADRTAARTESPDPPAGQGHPVLFTCSGWIQQVSSEKLLALVGDGGRVRVETSVGRYAVKGTPLCTLWPAPDDPEEVGGRAHEAIAVGPVRTMQQDPSYGIRQLADVALIALSPGVNDPTTAQDAIFHLADVLREALVRDLPQAVEHGDRGRLLIHAEAQTHERLVELAFDEIRQSAAGLPTVSIYLLEALHLLERSVVADDLADRVAPLRRQADLIVAGAERADLLPDDLHQVRAAFDRRFGDPA